MPLHHAHHVVEAARHTADALKELKPLKQRKNPMVAALVGFFFQAMGIALYFGSLKDFFICVGVFVLFFAILLPTVIGEAFLLPAASIFCAIYGAWRAYDSNAKLELEA